MNVLFLLLACSADKGTSTSSTDPSESSSVEPNSCSDGEVRETTRTCGGVGAGTEVDVCQDGAWSASSICLLQGPDEDISYPKADIYAGYFPVDWDKGSSEADRIHGWSYYLRAFDLIQDQPVAELGWGQWTKPGIPDDELTVCGIHPHGFTCEGMDPNDSELTNCGHTDYYLLEDCAVWCCSEEDKCGVRGSIEGGMGYWMYTLETQHVKWMMPASTNMNYEIFGGTFGHEGPKPCTELGGAVRVSNQILVPNDFFSFSGDKIDGFVGYMLSKTPIGKRSETDNANNWTIIIDTENYSGPVMYISAWFWDSRVNWHPESVSWSDPRVLIDYIAEGFEGGIGYIEATDEEGNRWLRTNRWALPQDQDGENLVQRSTLFTGHAQYNEDWAVEAMEPMLSGTGSAQEQSIEHVRSVANSKRSLPDCLEPNEDAAFRVGIEEGEEEIVWNDFGAEAIDAEDALNSTQQAAGCSTTLTLDSDKLACENGWCEGDNYLKIDTQGNPVIVPQDTVPVEIQNTLDLRSFVPSRRNDGRYLGPPAETEQACFDNPGPASETLYCTRTENGVWLGFKWYRFVDQPELNHVFASLPASEQEAAKCYMQERIERLHAIQNQGQDDWFAPPQGEDSLPKSKVSLDPAFIVNPPVGMEVGYVPITVFERKRQKPENCDVVLGENTEEPDPLPENYYEGYAYERSEYFTVEECVPNEESGEAFTYPGTIFGYPAGDDPFDRPGYLVPLKSDVASVLSSQSPVCGLPSDPQ